MPIRRRPERMVSPRRPFKPRPVSWKSRQEELPLLRDKVTVQVCRLYIPVWTKFVQRSRIRRHAKFQKPWLVPNFDGFPKRSRGENTVPHGANSVSGNLRPNRTCHPFTKEQFLHRPYLRK